MQGNCNCSTRLAGPGASAHDFISAEKGYWHPVAGIGKKLGTGYLERILNRPNIRAAFKYTKQAVLFSPGER